jgi:ATP-dependent HslUV protease ATP-binding subunit HslU
MHTARSTTPSVILNSLNSHIVAQSDAKRKLAVAFRNRERRKALHRDIQLHIQPSNVLLIGPTGVGKSQLAKHISAIQSVPFIKVDATNYTEVGYQGRDADSMVKDLYKTAKKTLLDKYKRIFEEQAEQYADQVIYNSCGISLKQLDPVSRKQLRVGQDRDQLVENKLNELYEAVDIVQEACDLAADGVIFIDEIDKLIGGEKAFSGSDVSSEGVQRDLLPIVEGTEVQVEDGKASVSTERILFIAAGAFSTFTPDRMLPELLGRFPITVNLHPLTEENLYEILTQTKYNIWHQKIELIKTEGVSLQVDDEALREIAKCAYHLNSTQINYGARRLKTVVEAVLEDIEFNAPDNLGDEVHIDKDYVKERTKSLYKEIDLSRYVL